MFIILHNPSWMFISACPYFQLNLARRNFIIFPLSVSYFQTYALNIVYDSSATMDRTLLYSFSSKGYVTLQCDPEEPGSCDSGCNGGLMNSAFEYTLKAGGLMREEDYPYKGTDRGTCKFVKSKIAASVANFSVVSLDEDQIAANLVKNGPLAGE